MRHRELLLTVVASLAASGCDALFSGLPDDAEVFDAPIEGLTGEQLAVFLAGDEAFARRFTPEEGLGPVFNARSCDDCHPAEGRGDPSFNLMRFGRGDPSSSDDFDYLEELGGPQLQDRAIPGYPAEVLPPNVAVSERGGPVTVGLGLLEAIPAATVLALADPDDVDGDGVSGRPNLVSPPSFADVPADCSCPACVAVEGDCLLLGRFGRKATAADLLQQTVEAYRNDMGVTSDQITEDIFNPLAGGPGGDHAPDPEVGSAEVANLVFYLRALRPPQRRNGDAAEVKRGAQRFDEIGCAACHITRLTTGPSPLGPLSHVEVAAYTDLLLHDMGPGLADDYPEGAASGREWRTTPLWGVGIVANVLGGHAYYLHDGRARTLREAVGWHGGEAEASRQAFESLDAGAQGDLLAFLRSL